MNDYKTITENANSEYVVQRSRFIGMIFPVDTESKALSIIESVRKEYWDARHCCYAFRIGEGIPAARSNDDGEPSGTAGKPILEILEKRGLSNVLLIVVRYFGGILLGTGGLTRAYSKAASDAVEAATIAEVKYCSRYSVNVPYTLWNKIETLLRMKSKITAIGYAENVNVEFALPLEVSWQLIKEITEKSDGKLVPEFIGNEFITFEV